MTKAKVISNQRGQMTIFVALIFQVLFVFFAMIINVGLIVHDKINLQNSADLAAYYGAQRQAEMLDAIAHENYQIRQAWKLLSWRLRVLGDMANKNNPISSFNVSSNLDLSMSEGSVMQGKNRYPVVCVNHAAWGPAQNLCSENANKINIPEVPTILPIAAFLPWNLIAYSHSKQLQAGAKDDCNRTGAMNFTMASLWMGAYRTQVAQAKNAIRIYATNLANGLDIRGESIAKGVSATLMNNLTRANKISVNPTKDLVLFNSINARSPQDWLHNVAIHPLVFYADLHGPHGCSGSAVALPTQPTSNKDMPEDLVRMGQESGDPNEPTNSSFGYEKNPWVMVYYGVAVHSTPRKPYLPFGDAVELTAKAFAKPFGGRIGPWYYNKWPSSSNKSSGNFTQRVDGLVPIDSDSSSGQLDPANANYQIPNYSRYPGDKLGLASKAAVLALAKSLIQKLRISSINQASYSYTPHGSDGLAYAAPDENPNLNTDSSLGYAAPWIRALEVAAIAPDLFDITYYSIDPDFYKDYLHNQGTKFLTSKQLPLDIGNSAENGVLNFNIKKQIALATGSSGLVDQTALWFVRNWENLLTGWMSSDAYTYDFPSETFGKCPGPAVSVAVPGDCAQGGRVGYSVKIVSEKYLKSSNLQLGGEGMSGAIQNPPPF